MPRVYAADCGDSEAEVEEAARAMLNGTLSNGTGVDVLIAPYSSRLTPAAARVADANRTLVVSGGSAAETTFVCRPDEHDCGTGGGRSGARRHAYLFGTMTPAGGYLRPFVSLARINQARTLALLAEDDSFPLAACEGAREAALENGMQVVYDETVDRVTDAARADALAAVDEAAGELRRLKPDVVVACTYAPACELLLERLEAAGFLPSALAATICVGRAASEAAAGRRLAYVYGPGQWDRRLKGAAYVEDELSVASMFPITNATVQPPPPEQFAEAFAAAYGAAHGEPKAPSYQAAAFLAALYAVETAAALANDTNSDALREQMQLIYEPSFFGLLGSSRFGSNAQKSIVTWQYSGEGGAGGAELRVVTPLSAAVEDAVYPMPGWSERSYSRCMYCLPAEHAVIAVVAVVSALSVGLAAWLWAYRDRPYIKQASAGFCVASVVASVVVYLGVLTWPVENNSATCGARPWMLGMGVTLMLAPLLAKTHRVMRVFSNKSLVTHRISDRDVLVQTAALAAPEFLILMLWSAVSPLEPALRRPDPLRPSENFTTCDSEHTVGFAAAAASYVLLLLVVAAAMAVRTRNVWDAFNDARQTSTAVWNLMFGGAMLGILEASSIKSRSSAFVARSLVLVFVTASTQAVLFVPKLANALAAIRAETAANPFDPTRDNHSGDGTFRAVPPSSRGSRRARKYVREPSSRSRPQRGGGGAGGAAVGLRTISSSHETLSEERSAGGGGGGGTTSSTGGGARPKYFSAEAPADDEEMNRPRIESMSSMAAAPLKPEAEVADLGGPLPDGWALVRPKDGSTPYYWHAATERSSWERPPATAGGGASAAAAVPGGDAGASPRPPPAHRQSEDERTLVSKLYVQLTSGCGSTECESRFCRSAGDACEEAEMDDRAASVRALRLRDQHGVSALCGHVTLA